MLGLAREDCDMLASCHEQIQSNIDLIVEEFYSLQLQWPEIALVIGDKDTLERLKRSIRSYIIEMFSGVYDVDYVNKRLRIGKVHTRIGVPPKLYTSALGILSYLFEVVPENRTVV